MRRLVLWSGLDSWRAEVANLEVSGDRLVAMGTQIGVDPVAYRLDYSLDAGPAFIRVRLFRSERLIPLM